MHIEIDAKTEPLTAHEMIDDLEREFLRRFIGDILENSSEEATVERKRQQAPNNRIYLENEYPQKHCRSTAIHSHTYTQHTHTYTLN